MPFVAFDVLAATAPHASRKPAAHADRDDSTPFSEMLDKSDKKPAATADKADKEASKDAAPSQSAAVKGKHDGKGDDAGAKAKKAETSDTADVVVTDATDATTDTTATDQDSDFLAAVAGVTGIPVSPADATKTDAKAADTKSDDAKADKTDKGDDKADAAAVPVTTDTKTSPVAAVVTVPNQNAPDATPADSTPANAAATVAIAEQGIAKAAAKTETPAIDVKTDAKAEAKTDKPQVSAKLDTPPLLTQPAADSAKQAADPQAAQTQLTQAQKPADAAQPAKPAQHDTPTPDVAAATKPADATPPMLLVQNNGLTAPQNTDQTAATAAPAATPQAAALPVQGIAIEIAGRALDGKKSFDIRLDPPELGKIHVRLDVDHKGEVTSIITADRSDTFDLLRRDAQSLERALNDAGVKTSSNGLQFSLRDQGAGQQNTPQQFTNTAHVVVRDDMLDTEITAPLYRSPSGARAGVDIRV